MKKRKSMSSIILCCILLIGCNGISVFASEPLDLESTSEMKEELINQNEDYITENIDKLINQKKNARSLPEEKMNVFDENGHLKDTMPSYIIQDEELKDNNGDSTGLYVTTFAAETGNKNASGSDSTGSVTIRSSIYYNVKTTTAGVKYYVLTKVSGGYSNLNSGVQITSQTVTYRESGPGESGSGSVTYPITTKYPTGSTFSYNTGYTKYVVLGSMTNFGCNYTVTLKRGSTWSYSLGNNL